MTALLPESTVTAAESFTRLALENGQSADEIANNLYYSLGIPNDQAQDLVAKIRNEETDEPLVPVPTNKEKNPMENENETPQEDKASKDNKLEEAKAYAKKKFDDGDHASTIRAEIKEKFGLTDEEADACAVDGDDSASNDSDDGGDAGDQDAQLDSERLDKAKAFAKRRFEKGDEASTICDDLVSLGFSDEEARQATAQGDDEASNDADENGGASETPPASPDYIPQMVEDMRKAGDPEEEIMKCVTKCGGDPAAFQDAACRDKALRDAIEKRDKESAKLDKKVQAMEKQIRSMKNDSAVLSPSDRNRIAKTRAVMDSIAGKLMLDGVAHVPGETPDEYEGRMVRKVRRFSKSWADKKLIQTDPKTRTFHDSVRPAWEMMRDQIFQDAKNATSATLSEEGTPLGRHSWQKGNMLTTEFTGDPAKVNSDVWI